MRALRGVLPIAESVGLILAVTAILWLVHTNIGGQYRLIYVYLFPVAFIAALYNGRLAVLSALVAMLCADLFLQDPIYSLINDNPREYGDLFVFALLAVPAIKFIRALVRPRTLLPAKSRSV